jgi:hypothetical protein
VAEIWAYSLLGDQLRFALVQRDAAAAAFKPRPMVVAAPKPAAPARAGANGQARTPGSVLRPAAAKGAKAKTAGKKPLRTSAAAPRRAAPRKPARAARPAARKSSSASRAKRK